MEQHDIFFLILSYLLGSIPMGYILYFITEKKDIRTEGSGNIGATNMLRSKGKTAAIITLVLDMAKGIVPIVYGTAHIKNPALVFAGGALAIIGHIFPVFLKFRGGKGVATLLGVTLFFYYPAALSFLAVFLITAAITKYVSAGSIMGVTAVFFAFLFTHTPEESVIALIIAIVITVRHRSNISRIIQGNENKINLKKNG